MNEKKCVFCSGIYEVKIDTDRGPRDRIMMTNLGIRPSGASHWIILKCKGCGHMAIFNPEK